MTNNCLTILIGKTASGKDTILNKLVSEYGYKKITTYTTRPIRKGEVDGYSYHFISDEEFERLRSIGFFLEAHEYHTVEGVWKYGSGKEDYYNCEDKTVVILTPEGVENLKHDIESGEADLNYKVVYVYANNSTINERLLSRGDDKNEASRRIIADNKDFCNATFLSNKIFYNNLGEDINELTRKIVSYLED